MIMLAVLAVQMMWKNVMHLFWATGALYEPNKNGFDAVVKFYTLNKPIH